RGDATVFEIEHEQAVAIFHRRVDRVGEKIALLIEGDVADAAEQLIATRREIVQDDVRAARAPPRWLRDSRSRRARCTARRCPTAPPTGGRAAGRGRGTATQNEMARRGRERERLNVL